MTRSTRKCLHMKKACHPSQPKPCWERVRSPGLQSFTHSWNGRSLMLIDNVFYNVVRQFVDHHFDASTSTSGSGLTTTQPQLEHHQIDISQFGLPNHQCVYPPPKCSNGRSSARDVTLMRVEPCQCQWYVFYLFFLFYSLIITIYGY
jgi:hypothetical protein